jgi:hypothetical protein
MIVGDRPYSFSNYTLEFNLQLRKSRENLGLGSRRVLGISPCVELVAILGAVSTGLLSMS